MGMSASAFFTLPLVLIFRRAIAIATFSLPWKYLFATSESIVIFTSGSQSTSSDHSQRSEQREGGRDREVRRPHRARHQTRLADLGIDLFAADDGHWNDRRAR